LWQQNDPGTGSLGLWSQQGPVYFQNYIVAGFPSGILVTFDALTGRPISNENFNDRVQASDNFNDLKALHASSDLLFASSFSGDLRAWEAMGGSKKLLWEKRLSLHAPMTLDEKNGILYLSARDGKVYAIDAKSGFLKWDYELPRGLGTQPSLSNDYIWVGTSAGLVVVLSKDGKLVARSNDYQIPIWNSIAVLDNNEALAISARANLRQIHIAKVN
jgi:outer membrane protein assembly factor BamB